MHKVVIEVAVNGGSHLRAASGHIPYSPREVADSAAAAVAAGATLVHYHARDSVTGRQVEDVAVYGEIARLIHERCDALVWPTINPVEDPATRFRHYIECARDAKPDLIGIDMGSTDFGKYDPATKTYRSTGRFHTSYDTSRFALEIAQREGYLPTLQIFDPTCLRTGLILLEQGHLPAPALFNLHFGGPTQPVGFPPQRSALEAYVAMLQGVSCNWFAGVQGGDALGFIPDIVALGGHLRIGLEDWLYDGRSSNAQIVERAAKAIREAGAQVASIEDARRVLGVSGAN